MNNYFMRDTDEINPDDDVQKFNIPKITQAAKKCVKVSWERPDSEFFKSGACHFLAGAFIEAYPNSGFAAHLIRPKNNNEPGHHVFVSRQNIAFDYRGYSAKDKLIAQHVAARCEKSSTKWDYEIVDISAPVITPEFFEKYGLASPDKFYKDPQPRAIKYLSKFPPPAKKPSRLRRQPIRPPP